MARPISELRRRVLARLGLAAAAVGVGSALPWPQRAGAQDVPHVSEDDPAAQALMYVEDASRAPADRRIAEAYCHYCVYFQGEPDDEWAPCTLFPGKDVAGRGWCSVWTMKS